MTHSNINREGETMRQAGLAGLARRFMADTRGGIMIIAGVASLFLLLLFMALSIDHGRNLVDHADLDAKVKNLSIHLAEDWAGFRQREATAKILQELGLTWERSDEETAILQKNSVLWELPEPFGPLNEGRAKQLLSQRMLELIRQHPGLERTSVVEVEQDCNSQNRMLLRFAAKIPMSEQFITPDNRANTVCTKAISPLNPQREDGCSLVTHTVALGIGCEPGDVPPDVVPPNGVGAGECLASNGDFPQTAAAGGGGGGALADGGKVITLVKSLDLTSAQSMQSADDFVEIARRVAIALDIPSDDMAAGAVIGNRPVASADGSVGCAGNADLGWSGSCYDSSEGFEGKNFLDARQANSHRKHSFVGTFLAQFVRHCDAPPVWTYDIKKAGECWEEYAADCTASGWDAGPCCLSEFHPDTVITDGTTTDGSTGSRNVCGKDDDLQNADGSCDNGNQLTRHTCMLKADKPVYQGQWYAACPRTAMNAADVYKDPKDFLKFEAHYSRKLDDGKPEHGLGFPTLEGTVSTYAGNFPGDKNQGDELETLKKYNTDRSWLWACETEFSPDGRMGRPYGRSAGRPLVDPGEADIAYAEAPGCRIPAAPGGGLQEYKVEYNLPGCSDPYGTGCDLPEGFFRTEIDVSDLKPAQTPDSAAMVPDGGKHTGWTYQGDDADGGWAYQEVATVKHSELWKECPVQSGDRGAREYKTSYAIGANEKHARYALDVPDEGGIVVPEIPEERLNIASYASERRRLHGAPVVCLFDKGDDNLDGTKGTIVEGPAKSGGTQTLDSYPWFSDGGPQLEHPFWLKDERGVLAFRGGAQGKFILGVEQNSSYPTHKGFTGSTDPSYDALGYSGGTRNLAQIQALDAVRWLNSDYPPANTPVRVGGMFGTLALASAPYKDFDIHGGHDANQCALMKAGAQSLMTSAAGADADPDERVLIYVGSCPREDWANTKFNGMDVNWHAGGNRAGALSGLQLQALETPLRGTNLRAQVKQCFLDVADKVGNVFIITSGEECRDFARSASKSSNPDLCPLPYCVLGPDSEGDCVDRLFSCIRKRATGGM